MKRLITFLGITYYRTTKYSFEGQEPIESEFFQEVLAANSHLEFDEMIVCLTDDARSKVPVPAFNSGLPAKTQSNWDALSAALESYPTRKVTDLSIPNGGSVNEIWDIFRRIADKLGPQDEVIFDITYGFRSLPMLALIAMGYLRATKGVQLRGIYYGAYDARRDGIVPVFDLTPFAKLLDLTEATNQFLETGSSARLSDMLRGERAVNSAEMLGEISTSLETLRTKKIFALSGQLAQVLPQAEAEIGAVIPPARDLLRLVAESYGKLGLPDSEIEAHPDKVLHRHHMLIHWYWKREQYVHCLTMAREWITSLMCYLFKKPIFVYEGSRDLVEHLRRHNPEEGESGYEFVRTNYPEWERHPLRSTIKQTLNRKFKVRWHDNGQARVSEISLADLRNDLDHAGFRENPRMVSQIADATQQIVLQIDSLAAEAGILNDDFVKGEL